MSNLLKLEFKHWQPEAVRRMVEQKRFAVFDTVGVGKTIEAIGAVQTIANLSHTKAVIVVESPHVMQWKEEFEKFSFLQVFSVTSGSKEKRTSIYNKFFKSPLSSVLIINYGKLRYDFDSFRINHIDCIIYDEALILSNRNETRQYACWLNQNIKYVFALTATPISRDIMQWYDLFECIGVVPLTRDIFLQTFAEYTIDRIRTKKGSINKINITGANLAYGAYSMTMIDFGPNMTYLREYVRYKSNSEISGYSWKNTTVILRSKNFTLGGKITFQGCWRCYCTEEMLSYMKSTDHNTQTNNATYVIGGTEWVAQFGSSDPYANLTQEEYDYYYKDIVEQG